MHQESPPDIDEALRRLREQLRKLMGAGGGDSGGNGNDPGTVAGDGAGGILPLLLLVLAVVVLYNSVYIIDEQERGVVLRFGKYATTINPGLSVRFPPPIERVYKVNVSKVDRYEHANAVMLTSDENLVNVSVAVQYRISDPEAFIFNVENTQDTLVKSVESAVREVVGKNEIDYVITEGRSEVSATQRELLQQTLDRYETGIQVVGFELLGTNPPDEVRQAFDDAVNAREDRRRLIEEAEAYNNDIIPKARGAAARLVEEAEAYKTRIVESATGEAERFSSQYEAYARAPEVTRRRLYIDVMQQVLQVSSKTMITDTGSSPLIYLPLDKMLDSSGSSGRRPGSRPGASSGGGAGSRPGATLPREATPLSPERQVRRPSR